MEELRKTVFLMGFPCCGKTTLGRELARLKGWPFVDLDEWIESREGKTVKQLFDEVGEQGFRQIESDALRTLAQHPGVVACGGGTPCGPGNMELMNASGLTVWLTTSEERLVARLCLPEHRSKRPHVAAMTDEEIAQYVHRTIKERQPSYALAQVQFDSTEIETARETTATARQLARLIIQETKL